MFFHGGNIKTNPVCQICARDSNERCELTSIDDQTARRPGNSDVGGGVATTLPLQCSTTPTRCRSQLPEPSNTPPVHTARCPSHRTNPKTARIYTACTHDLQHALRAAIMWRRCGDDAVRTLCQCIASLKHCCHQRRETIKQTPFLNRAMLNYRTKQQYVTIYFTRAHDHDHTL